MTHRILGFLSVGLLTVGLIGFFWVSIRQQMQPDTVPDMGEEESEVQSSKVAGETGKKLPAAD